MNAPTAVVRPGEGRSVWLGGMGVVFKVSGERDTVWSRVLSPMTDDGGEGGR